MLKGMVGTKELQVSVEGIIEELPAMRDNIVREVRKDMREEFSNAVQAYEIRMKNELRDFFAEVMVKIESVSKPDNVVKAIEVRESDKVREKEREEIIDMLSRIYAQENSTDIFLIGERGGIQWTEEGRELYDLFSKAVIKIAGYNGSKAHSKVANRTTYNEFAEQENLEEQLEKKELGGRMSVYVDLFERGLIGKFTKFLEERFLNESEAM